MSADQLLYSMDLSSRQDELFDLDNPFEFPSDYLDSNSTSVNSISPRDYELVLADTEALNWDSDPAVCSHAMFSDFVGYEPQLEGYNQAPVDCSQPFINPNDVLQSVPVIPQEGYVDLGLDSMWLSDPQSLEDPFYSSVRQVVESQAALDPRCSSKKEKRREASIALHLQRLQDASLPDPDITSHSNHHFSSMYWSDSPPGITPITPQDRSFSSPTSSAPSDTSRKSSPSAAGSESGPAGMQLVLDLNMNTTTNLPRKQKPRSRAQKENYIKARKYGVCEKHRKQHKRCNCLEKKATDHLNINPPSNVGPNAAVGLSVDRNLQVNLRSQRYVKNPTESLNTMRPLARQPVKEPMPDLSPTQSVHGRVPTAGRHPVKGQTPHPLPPGDCEPASTAAAYRSKHSQGKRLVTTRSTESSVPRPNHQLVHSELSSVNRCALNVQARNAQTHRVADTSLAKETGGLIHKTAVGLFSFWQGSTTLSSWAGVFFGKLVLLSSRTYMQSRKGMGLF